MGAKRRARPTRAATSEQLARHNRHGGSVFTLPELRAEQRRLKLEKAEKEERERAAREKKHREWVEREAREWANL